MEITEEQIRGLQISPDEFVKGMLEMAEKINSMQDLIIIKIEIK